MTMMADRTNVASAVAKQLGIALSTLSACVDGGGRPKPLASTLLARCSARRMIACRASFVRTAINAAKDGYRAPPVHAIRVDLGWAKAALPGTMPLNCWPASAPPATSDSSRWRFRRTLSATNRR